MSTLEEVVSSKPAKPADLAKRGTARVKNGFLHTHSVVVDFLPFGTIVVPEDHYRRQGYEPDFDQLPWREPSTARE